MAPTNPANTARLYIDYLVGGSPRQVQLRYLTAVAAAAAASTFRAVLVANDEAFGTNVLFNGARVADLNSNVTNPIAFTDVAGAGASAIAGPDLPRFVSMYGRDLSGVQVRWYFYGIVINTMPADYRFTGEEHAAFAQLRTDFIDFAEETGLLTVANLAPVIATYGNVGYNAYWQRQARG